MERVAEAWSREMRRGYAKLAVLTIISNRPSSGYGVIKEIREQTLGFWNMTTGNIYPLLQELEDKGYVEGAWEAHGRRRRKIYTITSTGRQLLEAAIQKQRRIADTLASLIQEYAHDVMDLDTPPFPPNLPMDPFTVLNHLKEQPPDTQIRILTRHRDQLQQLLTRINERIQQLL